MEQSDLITTITQKNVIWRTIQGIADQQLPIRIALDDSDEMIFRTQIARIEKEAEQIVVHQPKSDDWQQHIIARQALKVSCNMPNGTIRFEGHLSPLDGAENSPYCQLSFPEQVSKEQLRSTFRVSVMKYDSDAILTFQPGTEFKGECKDISQGGTLIHLPQLKSEQLQAAERSLQPGARIQSVRISIPSIIDLECAARICRAKTLKNGNLLVGLAFLDMGPKQSNALRGALIKLERNNIKN